MHASITDRIKSSVRSSRHAVFLRSDFERFGSYRQVSRALTALESDGVIKRAGYGVYVKPGKQDNVAELVSQIQTRLAGRPRIRRVVTLGDTTVALGVKAVRRNAQSILDEKKLARARSLVRDVDLATLRRRGLANIARWNANGVWCSAHDEWREILENADDPALVAVITGTDENSNRLRQTSPFTGLNRPASMDR